MIPVIADRDPEFTVFWLCGPVVLIQQKIKAAALYAESIVLNT